MERPIFVVQSTKIFFSILALLVTALGAQAQNANPFRDQTQSDFRSEAFLEESLERLEAEPDNFDLLWIVAAAASTQGAYDEAIMALERLLIYYPRDAALLVELGVAYYRLGAYARANRHFDTARALDPPQSLLDRIARFQSAAITRDKGRKSSNEIDISFGYRDNLFSRATGPSILSNGSPVASSAVDPGTYYSLGLSNNTVWTLDTPLAEQISTDVKLSFSDRRGKNTDMTIKGIFLGFGYQRPIFTLFDGYLLDFETSYRRSEIVSTTGKSDTNTWEVYLGGIKQASSGKTSLGFSFTKAKKSTRSDMSTGLLEFSHYVRLSPTWSYAFDGHSGGQAGGDRPDKAIYGASIKSYYQHDFFNTGIDARLKTMIAFEHTAAKEAEPQIDPSARLRTNRLSISLTEEFYLKKDFILSFDIMIIDQDSNIPNGVLKDTRSSIRLRREF